MTKTKLKTPDFWWEREQWDEPSERHRIVYIEYCDGWPHSVVTEEHWDHTGKPWFKPGRDKPNGACAQYWDFEFCKRHGELYCYNSGGGGDPLDVSVCRFAKPDPPPGEIWCADDVVLTRWESRDRPKVRIRSNNTLLKLGYRRLDQPLLLSCDGKRSRNPFEVAEEIMEGFAYCEVCDDHFPRDHECEHMTWCDKCSCLVYVDTHVREDSSDGKPVVHEDEEEEDD